jgi:hypothetical protein
MRADPAQHLLQVSNRLHLRCFVPKMRSRWSSRCRQSRRARISRGVMATDAVADASLPLSIAIDRRSYSPPESAVDSRLPCISWHDHLNRGSDLPLLAVCPHARSCRRARQADRRAARRRPTDTALAGECSTLSIRSHDGLGAGTATRIEAGGWHAAADALCHRRLSRRRRSSVRRARTRSVLLARVEGSYRSCMRWKIDTGCR